MSKSRLPILLTICLGWFVAIPYPNLLAPPVLAQSQEPPLEDLLSKPPEPAKNYEDLLKAGYASLEKKDFTAARKYFSQALEERPEDPIAQKALREAEVQSLQVESPPANNTATPPNASNQILLFTGLGLLSLVLLGTLTPLLMKRFLGDMKVSKPKVPNYQESPSAPNFDPDSEADLNGKGSPFNFVDEEEAEWNPALPVQRTTRLPNIDLVLQLIEDLKDPQPRVRRRAIWKLAQISDSRSMRSLVDTMIDTDSYDRSLILEALSQICIRTLRPMNQALAISLQDKNPQVRKNALRDLTRMYNVMAQISQLVAHATEDPDAEVQETAKWAMKQLNLPTPIKLDIPETVAEETETSEEASYSESAELES